MPALPFVANLLGWTEPTARSPSKPNMADAGSPTSKAIAGEVLNVLGITHEIPHVGQTAGVRLEEEVEKHLSEVLPGTIGKAPVRVSRRPPITAFSQYEHLAQLERLIEADKTMTLRASIGTDYTIEPDVTVGLELGRAGSQHLHAAVPCKWTLRSDRAQNIRHEAVIMIRHRRGRLPHITPVTAEPMPTRLASLARGTAEVDTVYHVALDELRAACASVGSRKQVEVLDELVTHDRLRDLSTLGSTLSI
ncbi:MAG TPA: NgoMIV family type II restriction endonuclease [Solirubrobacterales bacterium]